jgi:hypothetical protein
LTGSSASSIRSHLKNWFVGGRNQILTYVAPTNDILTQIFG